MVKAITFITVAATLLMAVSALASGDAPELKHAGPGHKFYKGTKAEREMRDKLLEVVKNDQGAAYNMLIDLKEGRADLANGNPKVYKRDTLMEPGHKIYKSDKKERELRDKLLEFVKNDEESAFQLLTGIRQAKAGNTKSIPKVQKRDGLIEPGHKIYKGDKKEREMRDKLLEFVKNDQEAAFEMLTNLREGRSYMARYTWNKL